MTIDITTIKQLREVTGAGPLDCRNALQNYHGDLEKAAAYLRTKDLDRAANKAGRKAADGLVVVKNAGDSFCAVELNCETDFVARTAQFKTLAHRLADQVLADAALTDADKVLATDFIDTPGKKIVDFVQELSGKLGENIVVRHAARFVSDSATIADGYIHAGAIDGYGPMEGRVGVLVELYVNNVDAGQAEFRDLAHNLALQITAFNPGYISPNDIPGDVVQKERQILTNQLAGANKPDAVKVKIVEGRLNDFYEQVCLLNQPFIKDKHLNIEQLVQQKSRETGVSISVKRFIRFKIGN